ncbi:hypothetical protein [Bradyrhizobium sp. USDA 3650]
MNNLTRQWWPWCLLAGGAVVLWALGYDMRDRTAITFMALLIAAAGGYLVLAERQKHK